jgi:hypothetical protein
MSAYDNYTTLECLMQDIQPVTSYSEYSDTRDHDEIDEVQDAFWYQNV